MSAPSGRSTGGAGEQWAATPALLHEGIPPWRDEVQGAFPLTTTLHLVLIHRTTWHLIRGTLPLVHRTPPGHLTRVTHSPHLWYPVPHQAT